MHKTIEPTILYFGTPVALISTLNPDGSPNLAPMSSAWWLGWSCMLGLGQMGQTSDNLIRTRDCVINLPSEDLATHVDRLALTTGKNPVPESGNAGSDSSRIFTPVLSASRSRRLRRWASKASEGVSPAASRRAHAALAPLDQEAAAGRPLDPAPLIALQGDVAPAGLGFDPLENVDVHHRRPPSAGWTPFWTLRGGDSSKVLKIKSLWQPDR